jgi:hypothetical protein
MRARVVKFEDNLQIEFDESMCIDTSIVPDFSNQIVHIYNNHLTSCINNIAMQSIECQVTQLLQKCSSVGALHTGRAYMFFKDKPNMICFYANENKFVFKDVFKRKISRFQFVFGDCNG